MARQYSELQLSSYVEQIFKRLELIEKQLRLVSEHVGIPMEDPAADVPQEVIDLVQAGDRLGAVKKYRELVGGDVDTAREAIAAL
jgi:hypothetical protein